MTRSLSGSPARKRQRLSSPTYDDQVEDLTQEDLAAFDEIEAQLSQAHNRSTNNHWGSSQPQSQLPSVKGFSFLTGSNLKDDPDNPFKSAIKLAGPSSEIPNTPVTFGSASSSSILSSALERGRSPSPESPREQADFEDWFKPAPEVAFPVFTTAKISAPNPQLLGFSKASNKGIIAPSEEALKKALAQRAIWDKDFVPLVDDEQEHPSNVPALDAQPESHLSASNTVRQFSMGLGSQSRPATNQIPSTPQAAFSRPSLNASPATPQKQLKPKPFKTPFLRPPHTPNTVPTGSPLNPQRPSSFGFTSALSHPHPLASPPISAMHNASSFTTPFRQNNTSVARTTPAPFKTPFRSGFRPPLLTPTPSNSSSSHTRNNDAQSAKLNRIIKSVVPQNTPLRKHFFCLTSPTTRQTLASSGLRPQQYDMNELEDMGINLAMLSQITPESAEHYNFVSTLSSPPPVSSDKKATFGPTEALAELLQKGCTLATQPWVTNHWCLILWKLAGMITLDPIRETKPGEIRWCWSEVMRQLLYRYERELNLGSRPPLRKVANQDAPAAFPMVLCVSNIYWSPAGVTEDGVEVESYPELELTDGWYRLRAQVDQPLARAIRRGIIRIGRKIGFAGARLSTEKKDPMEILEAYSSTRLVISGNSSHLMPWHARLGFTEGPCISTLHSLTADGGVVVALDFVITKLYPIAFIEFIENEDGTKDRIGPRNEAEELEVNEKWTKQYEGEASKLRVEYDKKFTRHAAYADRLERKSGSQFERIKLSDGYPPNEIDAMYDELEYPDTASRVISRATPTEAAWLALYIRRQNEKEQERIGEEIAKELQTTCPPRNVRSFRVLIIQDARTRRRPANRTAQLTVWDVLSLSLDEGSTAGSFEVGQRFMATNLFPQQQSAWMDCAPGSEVYLSTRRDTRWTRIKKTT